MADHHQNTTGEKNEAPGKPDSETRMEESRGRQSQRVPFSPREASENKDREIGDAIERRNAEFRPEDEETNKSDDPRIGTHGRD